MRRITRRGFTAGAVGAVTGTVAAGGARADDRPGPDADRSYGHGRGSYGHGHGHGPGHGGGPPHRRELRGMWIATVDNRDWPKAPGLSVADQKAELLGHLDTAVRRRLNTVYFQARPTADALWPSPYEPWSECLTGTQGKAPGWDPLGFVVREGHRRGLDVEAWFNPYRIALHDDPAKLSSAHPARRHPDWVVRYGGQLYYNPGVPQVRRFVQDAMFDAVARYDVDGMHWDDYFYPYPVPDEDDFDDTDAFRRYGRGFADRAAWRRHNIDTLVREASLRLRLVKPWLRFGISPFGVWRNATSDAHGSDTHAQVQTYDDLYADTRTWIRSGWLDYVVPQLYWEIGFKDADYATLAPWWARLVRGTRTRLYIGEGLYKGGDPAQSAAWQDPAELSRHLTLCERLPEVRGQVFFSAKEVSEDVVGMMDRVVADHYRTSRRAHTH
jgi:uncharacterized lipoprotein YddW (UPF0748 family)